MNEMDTIFDWDGFDTQKLKIWIYISNKKLELLCWRLSKNLTTKITLGPDDDFYTDGWNVET